jgi:chemotaxis protein methyltransferase CheR
VHSDLQPILVPQADEPLLVLHERDFLRISHLAHHCFGLDLRDGKQSLVAARLSRLVREMGFSSFQQYCDYLLADRTGVALAVLADRLTTNHTSFFREAAHFDFLCSTVLPALRTLPCINIWSAGCSSGEEPYSIALSILTSMPHLASRVAIRATDISTRMLERASTGTYAADRIQPIPIAMRNRYFVPADAPDTFRIVPAARNLVHFARHNLIDPFPALRFSVIFCRNVMLYFDRPTHQSLVQRLAAHLQPGGFLFIGHTDSLNGIDHPLEPAGPAVYRKPVRALDASRLLPFAPATTATPLPPSKEKVSA